MTIEITYDREAKCFVGHAIERGVLSAGSTWQSCIKATVSAVGLLDRVLAMSPAERQARLMGEARSSFMV